MTLQLILWVITNFSVLIYNQTVRMTWQLITHFSFGFLSKSCQDCLHVLFLLSKVFNWDNELHRHLTESLCSVIREERQETEQNELNMHHHCLWQTKYNCTTSFKIIFLFYIFSFSQNTYSAIKIGAKIWLFFRLILIEGEYHISFFILHFK